MEGTGTSQREQHSEYARPLPTLVFPCASQRLNVGVIRPMPGRAESAGKKADEPPPAPPV